MVDGRLPFDIAGYERRVRGGDCFICAIVRGEPRHHREHVIFRDDQVVVFLSQPPLQRGYSLVAPVVHREGVVSDFDLTDYLAVQTIVHRLGRALTEVTPTERLYVMSLGSQQGNAHVHWHVVPLPPGVPYQDQQFGAVSLDRGHLDISQDEQAELATEIAAAMLRQS
jgi:diadenosine tetraphosphate (Ap4A) HIT family hydrolase